MTNTDQQNEFIELRARGLSFDKIVEKIGVSKPTLIDWSRKLSDDIFNYRKIELDALYEKYMLQKSCQVERFAILMQKMLVEVEKRDLSTISTEKLIPMYITLMEKLNHEVTPLVLRKDVGVFEPIENIESWEV